MLGKRRADGAVSAEHFGSESMEGARELVDVIGREAGIQQSFSHIVGMCYVQLCACVFQ